MDLALASASITPTAQPSPCKGWTARDVVGHLVQTQREMLHGHGVDHGDIPDLEADPLEAWRNHTAQVLHALADETLVRRAYDGHFGPTTVGETVERFYVWACMSTDGTWRAPPTYRPS